MSDIDILEKIFNTNPDLPNWDDADFPIIHPDSVFNSYPGYSLENDMVTGLSFGDLPLKTIPEGISNLKNLKNLVFSKNPLTNLSNEFFQLTALKKLGFEGINLGGIPLNNISAFSDLEYLVLTRVNLFEVPREIKFLTKLEFLNLNGNNLFELPEELLHLKKLNTLYIRNNEFKIPEEVYRFKPARIIKYILNLQKQGASILNEGKIILLGDGATGKTALVERLVKGTFSGKTEMTEGIDITPWNLDDVILNIWDFGGQEIMRAMHQFFMTPRTLYVLVCTFRTDESEVPIESWLRLIQTFGGDSPIIIVVSKVDKHDLSLDENRLIDTYPNIKSFIRTSAINNIGIDTLVEEIKKAFDYPELSHIKDLIPTNQLAVKLALVESQSSKNYINLSEYYSICQENKVTENQEQIDLLRLLHDLGIAFNFGQKDNPSNTNILKPEWVTKGIYDIINNNKLFQQEGKISLSDLNEILKPKKDYLGKHEVIMGLMEQFNLCFSLTKNTWLVPDLLPKKQPYLGEQFRDSLQFQYQYDFLPRSIMPQFITRISEIAQQYWLHGVIAKKSNNDALVKVNYEKNLVSIFINGDQRSRRDFLDEIRNHLNILNDKIKGVPPKILVPLPDIPEVTVSYNLLLQHERAGKETVFIENIGDRAVKPLLNGVVSEKERISEIIDSFNTETELKRSIKNQELIQRLEVEKAKLQEYLKTKDRKYSEMEANAIGYANNWFSLYWVIIFIIVIIGVAIAIMYWESFGEPIAWAVEIILGLFVISGLLFLSPSNLFEKKKQFKMRKLIIYEEFDDEAYFKEKTRLNEVEAKLKELQND